MIRRNSKITLVALFLTLSAQVFAQKTQTIVVKANKTIADIQPTMYGIFFEDINFAADGGIYAELIKNRSFEFADPLMGWLEPNSDRHSLNLNSGKALPVKKRGDFANKHFIKVEVNNPAGYSIINEGFRGMGIKKGDKYDLTFMARLQEGIQKVTFQLISGDDQKIGEQTVSINSKEWKSYKTTISAIATEAKAKLKITFEQSGVIEMDMISMFPGDTWKGREKGLRKDLVQLLADLEPGFLRFPGGCIVEGRTLDRRYQWKKTVGAIDGRESLINRWNTEFDHRPTPDYFQSFGVGFYEYFLLSEDLGAEPLPILNCGMACQFNTGEVVPVDQLEPYIQDALDLIEFANGSVKTTWGKLRAEMGHEAPFNLKYLGVGNEQWGPQYIERYIAFEKVIKEKYPEIIIVSGTGPYPDGDYFEYAEKELQKLNAEIVDEHYYCSPEWFLENADRYDKYDRNGPKIFAGEYASQSVAIASPDNKNNWKCALAEAAFMTGLERNADVVYLTSYAPLLAHAEGWQWTPDLIWFNNLNAYGTPNYYVQKLFSTNKGSKVVPMLMDKKPIIGQNGLYASAVLDDETNEVILKIVNATGKEQKSKIQLQGIKKLSPEAKVIVLRGNNPEEVNSFEQPENISPEEMKLDVNGKQLEVALSPNSLNVVRIKQIR